MKAKVKSTGEIVDVVLLDECIRGILMYKSTEGDIYMKDSLEFDYYNFHRNNLVETTCIWGRFMVVDAKGYTRYFK